MTYASGPTATLVLVEVAKQVAKRWNGTCLTWDGNVPELLEEVFIQYKERMTIWQREMSNHVQDTLSPYLGEPTGYMSSNDVNVRQLHLKMLVGYKMLAVDVIQSDPTPLTNDPSTETKHYVVVTLMNAPIFDGVDATTSLKLGADIGQEARNVSTATAIHDDVIQRNAHSKPQQAQRHTLFETPSETLQRLGPRIFIVCILTQLVILAIISLYSWAT